MNVNPKLFWDYINSKRKSTWLPSVMRDSLEISDTTEILYTFTDTFNNYHVPSMPFSIVCDSGLESIVMSVEEVSEILSAVDTNHPDNIPGIVLLS